MNRTELCARIAARSSLSRADAATARDTVVSAIAAALERGEAVNIAGFGKFATTHRAPRPGRNPHWGNRGSCGSPPRSLSHARSAAAASLRSGVHRSFRPLP